MTSKERLVKTSTEYKSWPDFEQDSRRYCWSKPSPVDLHVWDDCSALWKSLATTTIDPCLGPQTTAVRVAQLKKQVALAHAPGIPKEAERLLYLDHKDKCVRVLATYMTTPYYVGGNGCCDGGD